MIRITFTEDEIQQLQNERFTHHHPRVRRKMEVVFLKSQGFSHQEIGKLVGITQDTLRKYLEQYISGGIEELRTLRFNKPTSPLDGHRKTIESDFAINPPATLIEAASQVEKLTGIKRSPKQIGRFLKK